MCSSSVQPAMTLTVSRLTINIVNSLFQELTFHTSLFIAPRKGRKKAVSRELFLLFLVHLHVHTLTSSLPLQLTVDLRPNRHWLLTL